MPSFGMLDRDIHTDVLIIGGGIAGLLTAYELKQRGVRCTVVEARKICGGVTGSTTAKITSQHGLIYAELIRRFGVERAKRYYEANEAAIARYRELSRNIECHFEERDAYVYSFGPIEELEAEVDAVQLIGGKAEFVTDTELPFPVAGAVKFPHQAQFDPLKFLLPISLELQIYENTEVTELIGCTAVTPRGRIKADKIIVATHFPYLNKHGSNFLKLYQERSYVLAVEGAQKLNGMYIDARKGGLSFRDFGDTLLLGIGGHRPGKPDGEDYEFLEAFVRRHYPSAKEVTRWATQDCMTLDGIPYIGQYSAGTPDLFVATGFNKWGMTSAMVSSMILADLIEGKPNPYAETFSPSRSMLRPQLLANSVEAAADILTPGGPRCPHMGCALHHNDTEHSWDCPCHGSRFAEDGTLLEGPATGNLKHPPRL